MSMNAIKAYTAIAKLQNKTINPIAWLQCEEGLLYIDQQNMFVTSQVFKANYPSL